MELTNAIFNRRSIRRFTDYRVTDAELHEMLEAARYAPSWANTQTWRFVIIRDRDLISKITETYSETNPARKCSSSASVLIAACAVTNHAGFKGGEQYTKFAHWHMFDLGMAVQNLCLRAHELGLGTVVVGSLDHDRCNALLSIPQDMETVVVIPVGKPEEEAAKKPAPKRKEIQEFVYLDRFNTPFTES